MNETSLRPDKRAVRRAFHQAAASYDDAAVLQREVGRRLMQRFDLIRLVPERVLDAGAGTGMITGELMRRWPKARFTAIDVAPAMLRRARRRAPRWRRLRCVGADLEALPFATDSFDVVFSNLVLQWVGDLARAFGEVQRVLRPDGVFMFSSFGPDTLTELRSAWSEVDGYRHVNRFVDMHDVGDALARARLAEPVMDMEVITMTYAGARGLMRDLKAIGAHHVIAGRRRGLTGRTRLQAMEAAYERFRDRDGRLPATWEVVYGHAWGTGNLFRPHAQSAASAPAVTEPRRDHSVTPRIDEP